MSHRPSFPRAPLAAALLSALLPVLSMAQQRPAAAPAAPAVVTRTFGDLGEGPYKSLVIRNAMVIAGHGGPPTTS
jgi:hypothetical protein